MSWGSLELETGGSDAGRMLGWNETNMTNSTPFYQEDDARWCYVEGRVEVCVRKYLSSNIVSLAPTFLGNFKISVMLLLSIITGIILFLRIVQYHWYKSKNYSQYVIYYSGLLLTVLSVIHWAYVSSAIIDFFTTFMVVFQLLVIAHFFCSWAARILQKESIFTYIVAPALLGLLLYFFSVTVWAILQMQKDTHECTQPQWLLFSSSQLILVQMFFVAVVYISRKLNTVCTERSNRLSQKAQLWGLAVVYEVVAIVTFSYDLALLITRSNDDDCRTFFTSNNSGIVAIYIVHGALKYLAPQWSIAFLFSPLKRTRIREEIDSLSWAQKPNYQSTFYRTSSNSNETEHLIPYSVNHSINRYQPSGSSNSYGIGSQRAAAVNSPYNNAPWLKTKPGQTFPTQQALQS